MAIYVFSDLVLDVARRTLTRDGREIALAGRAFDVLVALIFKAPTVVSKSLLIDIVWDGVAVEDNCVERTILAIRRALNDDAKDPRYIKTVRSRGYLFIGEAQELTYEPVLTVASTRPRRFRTIKSTVGAFLSLAVVFASIWFGKDAYRLLTNRQLFSDDFTAREISTENWTAEGSRVRVVSGSARISIDNVDGGGVLRSREIAIDPSRPLSVKAKMRVAFNQSVEMNVDFVATFGFRFPGGAEDDLVGVKYAYADGEFCYPGNIVRINGFYLTQKDGDVRLNRDHVSGRIGPRIEPLWGEWFTQELIYDPKTETLTSVINDHAREEMVIGELPLSSEKTIQIEAYPKGWWLHHLIEIDEISVTQPA